MCAEPISAVIDSFHAILAARSLNQPAFVLRGRKSAPEGATRGLTNVRMATCQDTATRVAKLAGVALGTETLRFT